MDIRYIIAAPLFYVSHSLYIGTVETYSVTVIECDSNSVWKRRNSWVPLRIRLLKVVEDELKIGHPGCIVDRRKCVESLEPPLRRIKGRRMWNVQIFKLLNN